MTAPAWIPTPETLLPDPAVLLGLFADLPPGNIGADDMRALVQAAFSGLFWQQTTDELLTQQVIDIAAVVSTLLTDVGTAQADIARQQTLITQLVADSLDFTTRIAALEARP